MLKKLIPLIILGALAVTAYNKREDLYYYFAIRWQKIAFEDQIRSDFAPFQAHGITQEAIDQTFAKIKSHHIHTCRYRIIDGKIYRQGEKNIRTSIIEKMLKRISLRVKLPNVDFLMCMMDGAPEEYTAQDYWIMEDIKAQAPLFTWATKSSAKMVVLVPDIFSSLRDSWQTRVRTINKNYDAIPWEKKEEVAFWRGMASDKSYTVENFMHKPRFLISKASKENPDRVNAGYTAGSTDYFTDLFKEMGLIKKHAEIEEHLHYKYLPCLDGWVCTYPGYQWRLLSGSLTLKQESDEIQYFYSELKPYVHYLPVKNDMSDLLEKIEWAKAHDKECKQIAQNARSFAEKNLMLPSVYAYFYRVLKTYASLQKFDLRDMKKETESSSSWTFVRPNKNKKKVV